ncbi:MAG: ABC transporter ATP-binding protein [Clostridia bacterium]|nr:ABC transporter ATP-binding protein [Clostridia bacterium]
MIDIRGLTVAYPDGTRAVEDVTLTVGDGESVALIGANGAGKTSLLLALVGILPSEGAVEVDGLTLGKKTAASMRERIGLVFQNPDDQLFMPTVFDDVAFGLRNRGLPESEIRVRVDECLARLGIAALGARTPLKLSGGEKRMAALATVLVMEPRVMLFDEPTAFLDPRARRVFADALTALPQARIVATHDLAFAARRCTRAVLLREGRIYASGPAAELLRDTAAMAACGIDPGD